MNETEPRERLASLRCSTKSDKVFAALATIQAETPEACKDAKNPTQNYRYASFGEYLRCVRPGVKKAGCSVVFTVLGRTDDVVKLGKEARDSFRSIVHGIMHFRHVESGQWIEIEGWGMGFDYGDKSGNKAVTNCRSYLTQALFNLTGYDDPESDASIDEAEIDEAEAPKVQTRRPVAKRNGAKDVVSDLPARPRLNRLLMEWGAIVDPDTGELIPHPADVVAGYMSEIRVICGVAAEGKLSDEDCAKVLRLIEPHVKKWKSPDEWLDAMKAMAQGGAK